MNLTYPYLVARYDHWKEEIGKAGIWQPELFAPVSLYVRPKSRNYNGLFIRRYLKKEGKKVLVDRIFIYKNSDDFDPVFLDSVIVHEMIHQYIIQNKIKDTSTHGNVFKSFMTRINSRFPGQLKIHVSGKNPSVPLSGKGNRIHKIILAWTRKDVFCCVINPSKVKEFNRIVNDLMESKVIEGYKWAVSDDVYFDRFTRCTKTLHGKKIPSAQLAEYCRMHNVVTSD